jgi:hypothetical protein
VRSTIAIVSGNLQASMIGMPLNDSVVIQVNDGNAVPNVMVRWQAIDDGGSVS